MTYREEQIKRAKTMFANHVAHYKQLDDIETLTWQNKNGGSNYCIRYVFDVKRCCLYVSGDLGSAVVQLTEAATLKTLSTYIDEIDYFVRKIECATNDYDYPDDQVQSDLQAELLEWLEICEDDPSEIEQLKTLFEQLPEFCDRFTGWNVPSNVIDELSIYNDNCMEHILPLGRRISDRVIQWLVGINMAQSHFWDED